MSSLRFEGHAHFRQRVVCGALSSRTVTLNGVRAMADEVGLRDFEVSFLRLIEKLSSGVRVEINTTGARSCWPRLPHGQWVRQAEGPAGSR